MAAAEARAVWQRAANRCFVQEDTKRAPKLACCQSSSSSESRKADVGSTIPEDGRDPGVPEYMPFSRKPSFCNIPSDTRWWVQLQPRILKGLPCEQLNASGTGFEILRSDEVASVQKDDNIDGGEHFSTCMSKARSLSSDSVKAMGSSDIISGYEFVELESLSSSVSKLTKDLGFDFDPDSPWIGRWKSEPWWRTADKDDIASLVAKKSHDRVENCDLPPPQKVHVTRHPYSRLGNASESLFSNPTAQNMGSPDFEENHGMNWGSADDERHFAYRSGKSSSKTSYSMPEKDMMAPSTEPNPSKAELLEALCHSQTRAREAEKAAKRANVEKDRVIKLFFKQASQLFAYRQWFQLLQLESTYFQIKENEDEPSISKSLPEFSPRMACRGKRIHQNWKRTAKGKKWDHRELTLDLTKYAVAIALGLSLVSAGLVLGWTVGWMLPSF